MPYVRAVAIAVLLVGVCIAYVPTRGEVFGPALVGDALSYAAMISGSDAVESPYRFRIVVPWLARALPLAPAHALALLSYLSLAATYACLLLLARALRIGAPASLIGLLMAIFTAPHLYNFHNPYLTDSSGLLVTTGCLFALVAGRYGPFLLLSVVGVGIREALLVSAPSWLAKREYVRTLAAVALPLALYVVLRMTVGMNPALNKGPFVFPARPIGDALREAVVSWHVSLLLVPLGLARLERSRRELVCFALLLACGALVTSLIASDTMRMVQPLFPVVAIAHARLAEATLQVAPRATVALLMTNLAASWVWQPVRFFAFERGSPNQPLAQAVALFALSACALLVFNALRGTPERSPEAPRASVHDG